MCLCEDEACQVKHLDMVHLQLKVVQRKKWTDCLSGGVFNLEKNEMPCGFSQVSCCQVEKGDVLHNIATAEENSIMSNLDRTSWVKT